LPLRRDPGTPRDARHAREDGVVERAETAKLYYPHLTTR